MVLHVSQMAVALLIISVLAQEEVFRQLKEDGEKNQQFTNDLVVDVACKQFDCVAVRIEDFGMWSVKAGMNLGILYISVLSEISRRTSRRPRSFYRCSLHSQDLPVNCTLSAFEFAKQDFEPA
jgi:hypothetical protein